MYACLLLPFQNTKMFSSVIRRRRKVRGVGRVVKRAPAGSPFATRATPRASEIQRGRKSTWRRSNCNSPLEVASFLRTKESWRETSTFFPLKELRTREFICFMNGFFHGLPCLYCSRFFYVPQVYIRTDGPPQVRNSPASTIASLESHSCIRCIYLPCRSSQWASGYYYSKRTHFPKIVFGWGMEPLKVRTSQNMHVGATSFNHRSLRRNVGHARPSYDAICKAEYRPII